MKCIENNNAVLRFNTVTEAMEASKLLDSFNIPNQFIYNEKNIIIDEKNKAEAEVVLEEYDYSSYNTNIIDNLINRAYKSMMI